jgi:epoxyqueuosine reductase
LQKLFERSENKEGISRMFESTCLSSAVKELALHVGFDQVGITAPTALGQGEEIINVWVGEGRHGQMKYLEDFAERRERFFQEFNGEARSVIVLGVNYWSGESRQETSDTGQGNISPSPQPSPLRGEGRVRGRVARYAWGKDYHYVIRQKHEEFIGRLKELIGDRLKAKSCVDTQPIPERFAAQKAGLGFLGKHTGLLNQKFGPWLFLSEIVTNLDLEEDMPSQGDCGTCTHCQKVCPTGALDKDYKIDARLCIAYLTIEHKGVIPRELRPKIKDWIFGCDECLNICPFTAKSKESQWKEFRTESGFGEWLHFKDLFSLSSNSDYERKFHGTALLRANRKQMLRNACLVLGNSGREEAIPYLEKALQDKSPLVRLHAAWALGQLPYDRAKQLLLERLHEEPDEKVRAEISLYAT